MSTPLHNQITPQRFVEFLVNAARDASRRRDAEIRQEGFDAGVAFARWEQAEMAKESDQ